MDTPTSHERVHSRAKVKKHLRRAAKALRRDDRDRARDHLRAALERVPGSLEAYPPDTVKLLLTCAEVAGALDGSLKVASHLRAYLAQHGRHAEVWEALVRLLLAAGKGEEAAQACAEALVHLPARATLRLLQARALAAAGAAEDAQEILWAEAQWGAAWREALLALEEVQAPSARLSVVCGHRLRQDGDPAGAREAFDRALREDPRCVEALEAKARLFAAEARWGETLTAVQEALGLESTRGPLWSLKARAEEALGQSEEALRSLQVCVRYEPEDLEAASRLAVLLRQQGRPEEALEVYATVAEGARADPDLLDGWRAALREVGRWDDLRGLCQEALGHHPTRVDLRLDVAASWVATGEPGRARSALEEVASGEDLSGADLRRLADLALEAGTWDLALRAGEGLLDRDRRDRAGLRVKARALQALGRDEEALKVLTKATKVHRDRELLEAKRQLLRSLDRPKPLFLTDEEIVGLEPEALEVWLEMARTASALGKDRLALSVCDRGLRANPGHPALRLQKADLLRSQGRPGDALRLYEVVAQEDGDPRAWKGCGLCLAALRAYDEARTAFDGALAAGEDGEAWYHRALCVQALGDPADALASLDRAVEAGATERAWMARGLVLMEMARWEDALYSFDQVLGRDPDRLGALLRKAECLLALEDPPAALRTLEEAGPEGQATPECLVARVRCLEALGRDWEAYEAAVALTEVDRRRHEGWTLRARLAQTLGHVTEARYCLARVAKLEPGDPAPRVGEAEILLALGEVREALQLAEEALALDPANEGAHRVRGEALVTLGHGEEAVRAFDAALEVGGDHEASLRGKALVLVELGRTEEALAAVERLVAASPSDPWSHHWKAVVLGKAGRWEEALKSVNQALYYGGSKPEVLAQKGVVLGELGRTEEALRLLGSTVDAGRGEQPVVAALVTLLLRERRYEEALVRTERVLADDSRNDEMMLLRAQALGGLGRWDEATEALVLGAARRAPPKEVWLAFASLHREQGRTGDALACYDQALQEASEDAALWKGRGRLCEALGAWEEAARSFAAAAQLRPQDEGALSDLGRAYGELGRYDEAQDAYRQALAINPASPTATEGSRRVEARRRRDLVSRYAWNVLEFEVAHGRPATREDAFRFCHVPMDLLPEVLTYVNEPDPLDILALPEAELRTLEERSREVLRAGEGDGMPRLSQVLQEVPQIPPGEARRVLGYVQGVLEADVPEDAFPGMERLMKLAMDLDREEWEVLTLARELGIGAYRAKTLEAALQAFREETVPEAAVVRPTPSSPSGERRCHRHGAQGLYQHLCGQYLCSACVVGGRCPICRHPVAAVGRALGLDEAERGYG